MIIYGKQPVLYLIEKRRDLIKRVLLSKKVDSQTFKKFFGLNIKNIDSKKAQSLAKGGNHQGFFAEIDEVELKHYREIIKKSNFVLILHSITDIGNIGNIVRTAYSLGVDGIIVTGINNFKVDGVIRTSAGAFFSMEIAHFKNIYDVINELKQLNFSIYGATLLGEDVRELTFPKKRVLILGNESDGIPNRVLKSLDKELTIKMEREFDSLNVGVASAILIDRMR